LLWGRCGQVGHPPNSHHPAGKLFFDTLLHMLFQTVHFHRGLELPVRQMGKAQFFSTHPHKCFHIRIPGSNVFVANGPVYGNPFPGIGFKVQVAEAVALLSPEQRSATRLVAPDPVETFYLYIGEQRFRNHPKNKRRAIKASKKMKTIAGRLVRELQRNFSSESYKKYEKKLEIFERIINQKREDKNKLYSLHELEVYCISKGKEHKKYEFGSKASIVTTKNSGIIIGAMNVKNEYDGHTLPAVIKQSEELRGVKIDKLIVDRGYKGTSKVVTTIIQRPEKPKKSDTPYQRQKKRKDFGRRAAIEPIISHLKTDFLLSRNYLKGAVGDSINLTLSCAAFNFRKYMRKLEFIFAIFRTIMKSIFDPLKVNFETF
jgi:hypothetical protein